MAKKVTKAEKPLPKLAETVAAINKHFGKRIVKPASELEPIRRIRTGELALDYVLGGGVPLRRFIEFLGAPHSGKTRDVYKIIEAFQRFCGGCYTSGSLSAEWKLIDGLPYPQRIKCDFCKNPKTAPVVIVDYEKTTDKDYIQRYFDIDLNGVLIVTAEKPSEVVDIVEALIRDPESGLIVIDSIGMMSSDSEIDRSQAEIKMNEGARFMNMAIRKWQAAMNANANLTNEQSLTTVLFINRTYETLSLYSQKVAQGGHGLRHAKSITIDHLVKEKIKDKDGNIIAVRRMLKNLKNKAGFPYRYAEDYLYTDERQPEKYMKTNIVSQYVDFALRFKIVEMKGGWYVWQGKKWHGRLEFEKAIMSTGIIEEVNKKIYGDSEKKEK